MRILITGGTGFVGRHLVAFWRESGHAITVVARKIEATYFDEKITCIATDITSKKSVEAAIFSVLPDVVVHTAAMSKPNDCEADQTLCYATNVAATQYILEACKAIGAKLVFLSTDFVFSDKGPYVETDAPEPVSYYGESKKLAEEAIRSGDAEYAIVRTGLVVGPKLQGQANTFLHWVKDSLQAGKTIQLYTDQQRSPTFITDLCRGIDAIIQTGFFGIIHLSGSTVFSPYSLAQQVARYFTFNELLLIPVTAAERPEPARRPANAVLNIDKAKDCLNYTTTPFSEVMKAVFEE